MPYTVLFFSIALVACTGVFWSIAYILIIKKGFQDKTYGMPMAAICANLSWEFIFSFIYPYPVGLHVINMIWFFLDIIILLQFLAFGKKEFEKILPGCLFYPTFLFSLGIGFLAVLFSIMEFHDYLGKYAAYSQNLMMSILFILLLLKRNSISGQSMYIAVFKMLGTLMPSILFIIFLPTKLIVFLAISTLIFDWIYIILLYLKHRELGINPRKL